MKYLFFNLLLICGLARRTTKFPKTRMNSGLTRRTTKIPKTRMNKKFDEDPGYDDDEEAGNDPKLGLRNLWLLKFVVLVCVLTFKV